MLQSLKSISAASFIIVNVLGNEAKPVRKHKNL